MYDDADDDVYAARLERWLKVRLAGADHTSAHLGQFEGPCTEVLRVHFGIHGIISWVLPCTLQVPQMASLASMLLGLWNS